MTEPREDRVPMHPRVLTVLTERERLDVEMSRTLLRQADYQFRINKANWERTWDVLRLRYGFGPEAQYDVPTGSVYVVEPNLPGPYSPRLVEVPNDHEEPEEEPEPALEGPPPPPALRTFTPPLNRKRRRK